LARYVYEWKPTQFGNRLFRRPGSGPRAVKVKATKTAAAELTTLKKDELIELASEKGVDTAGTKADIIERLEGDS
jgi:hypothetical protein